VVVASRRERNRIATLAEIKASARAQMAERGAAALSLREVARQMGMSSAAIYRYFENRDDLVTALIVDAYADLAVALDAAAAAEAPTDRFLDLALAYRAWALNHPADYALILGTPIPGYHAPDAITRPAAHRSMVRFVEVALAAGGRGAEPTAGGRTAEMPARGLADLPPAVRDLALAGWGQMHGLVSLELFGHLDALGEDPGTLYRYEMAAFAARIGSSGAPDDAAPTSPVARAE
jgi:AcrR family transcriptional regulator